MEYKEIITLKDGRTCVLRNGTEADGKALLDIYLLTHEQTDFLLSYPDEAGMTVQQEAQFLKQKTESPDEVELLAEVDGSVVGAAGVGRVGGKVKVRHRADFGISVDERYWGLGIGRALTRACIALAKQAGYEQLELEAVADNERALALYRSEGFREYGRNPKGFRSRFTGWQELVLMRRELREPAARETEAEEGSSALVQAAMAYVQDLFQNDFGGHDAAHTLRVYRNALAIAEAEPPCDREIVALGALLHDVDDHKLFATENNENARRFLAAQGVDEARIEEICRVINAVSFSQNRGRRPETPEGRIVQDADRLDALGAVGIARTFAYGGAHGRSLEASIQHFHEKLLLIRDELNTDTARRLAEKRHGFLKAFLAEYEEETRA